MLLGLLAVGFLLGLRHALDPDHVVAVASLAARRASLRETARIAAAWGVGHSAVLLVFGAALILLGAQVPARTGLVLEGLVGVMLIVLGIDVILRARRRGAQVHAHAHRHAPDADPHVHLHTHEAGAAHHAAAHAHPHAPGGTLRALFVGSVHGLAGTAALVLFAVPAMKSPGGALAYLVVFGLGTIASMVAVSILISVPLKWSARRVRRASLAVDALLGLANISIGLYIAALSVSALF